jgi:hypothetical protein
MGIGEIRLSPSPHTNMASRRGVPVNVPGLHSAGAFDTSSLASMNRVSSSARLIELLVIVTIIAILTGLLSPAV